MTTLINENIYLGLVYSFRDLVHCLHDEKHDIMQADITLEKDLRVLTS